MRTFLFSNVVELESDAAGRSVRSVRLATLQGNEFRLAARYFVLATGGIDNARILLLSNSVQPQGLGNQHDLVGRFFMEHPYKAPGAWLLPEPGFDLNFSAVRPETSGGEVVPCMNWLALTADLVTREQLAGYSAWPEVRRDWCCWAAEGGESLRYLLDSVSEVAVPDELGRHVANVARDFDLLSDRALFEARKLVLGPSEPSYVRLITSTEHVPNPESRVTLSNERDRLGQNRPRLNIQETDLDRRTIVRGTELLAAELGRAGFGRVRVLLDEGADWPFATGRAHHIGTTRMSSDPRRGVVDPDCRVHGLSNLFVAGSSTFPTSGFGVPTLTIVALAVRLAEHLNRVMEG